MSIVARATIGALSFELQGCCVAVVPSLETMPFMRLAGVEVGLLRSGELTLLVVDHREDASLALPARVEWWRRTVVGEVDAELVLLADSVASGREAAPVMPSMEGLRALILASSSA
jgi:hypothetical protein